MNASSERFIFFRLKLFMFFMFGAIALFLPYLPLYFQRTGFSPSQIGLLLTIGPAVAVLSNLFWGCISDKYENIKRTLLILMAGSLAASQFLFHVSSFYLVFVGMIVFYFFNSAINPINNSQVFQTIENTNHRFGAFRIWGSLGYAVIVLAAGPVLEWVGIGQLGWVYGISILAAFLLGVTLHRPLVKAKKHKPTVTLRASLQVLVQKRFAFLLLATLFVNIPNSINASYLSLFLEDLGGAESSIGWSMFTAAILEVPLFLLLDRFAKPNPVSMIRLLLFATGMFAVRWLLMSLAVTPTQIILIQFTHCLSSGFYIYTAAQLVEYLTDRSLRASGQTMYALVQSSLSLAAAGSLGGFLYEAVGPRALFQICVGLTLIGLAFMTALYATYGARKTGAVQQTENTSA